MAVLYLKTGEPVLVDDEDLPKVAHIKWYRHKQGYAVGYVPSSFRGAKDWHLVLMHQLILPVDGKTDHENGNRLDNQKQNLRPATNQENARNISIRTTPGKTSRFKGVCWHPQRYGVSKWMVRVGAVYVGVFSDEIAAAKAYNAKAMAMFGEFAKLNPVS